MPFWPWEIVERDHELQNPTSAEKIRLLGEYLRLARGSRVLDTPAASGPARILAAPAAAASRATRSGRRSRTRRVPAPQPTGLGALITVETARRGSGRSSSPGLRRRARLGAALRLGRRRCRRGADDRPCAPAASSRSASRSARVAASRQDRGRGLRRPRRRPSALPAAASRSRASSPRPRTTRSLVSLHWRAVEEWLAETPTTPDLRFARARAPSRDRSRGGGPARLRSSSGLSH